MDTALVVALWVCQLVTAAVGVYVSLKPQPKERHKWLILFFCVLLLVGVVINVLQTKRAARAQAALKAQLDQIQNQGSQATSAVSRLVSKPLKVELVGPRAHTAEAAPATPGPSLRILYGHAELDGRTITLPKSAAPGASAIQIRNSGGGPTASISLRLYLSTSIPIATSNLAAWQPYASDDPQFPQAFYLGGPVHISPGETWVLSPWPGQSLAAASTPVRAKIRVFYGASEPAEARFSIRITP